MRYQAYATTIIAGKREVTHFPSQVFNSLAGSLRPPPYHPGLPRKGRIYVLAPARWEDSRAIEPYSQHERDDIGRQNFALDASIKRHVYVVVVRFLATTVVALEFGGCIHHAGGQQL